MAEKNAPASATEEFVTTRLFLRAARTGMADLHRESPSGEMVWPEGLQGERGKA